MTRPAQGSKASPALVEAARTLSNEVSRLKFSAPVAYVYNPLEYAWTAHATYLERFGAGTKRVIFLGMNPGPFGMAQTGVPFGEIAAVRDWMGIYALVGRPHRECPKRMVEGFACTRSEVSGRRLWGLFAQRFGSAEAFFRDHFVANYCPLVFMDEGGRNLTPDKLPATTARELDEICGAHLRRCVELLGAEWLVGVGDYAAKRAQEALEGLDVKVGRILHPSPASPAANRDWSGQATAQMKGLGLWE